jgi:hypothetical protein
MGNRTPDLLNAIEALYQLSYDPVKRECEYCRGWEIIKRKIPKNRALDVWLASEALGGVGLEGGPEGFQ